MTTVTGVCWRFNAFATVLPCSTRLLNYGFFGRHATWKSVCRKECCISRFYCVWVALPIIDIRSLDLFLVFYYKQINWNAQAHIKMLQEKGKKIDGCQKWSNNAIEESIQLAGQHIDDRRIVISVGQRNLNGAVLIRVVEIALKRDANVDRWIIRKVQFKVALERTVKAVFIPEYEIRVSCYVDKLYELSWRKRFLFREVLFLFVLRKRGTGTPRNVASPTS